MDNKHSDNPDEDSAFEGEHSSSAEVAMFNGSQLEGEPQPFLSSFRRPEDSARTFTVQPLSVRPVVTPNGSEQEVYNDESLQKQVADSEGDVREFNFPLPPPLQSDTEASASCLGSQHSTVASDQLSPESTEQTSLPRSYGSGDRSNVRSPESYHQGSPYTSPYMSSERPNGKAHESPQHGSPYTSPHGSSDRAQLRMGESVPQGNSYPSPYGSPYSSKHGSREKHRRRRKRSKNKETASQKGHNTGI